MSESWREFFADYRRAAPHAGADATAAPAAAGPRRRKAPPEAAPGRPTPGRGAEAGGRAEPERRRGAGEPIRGAAARIVANMEASLAVPTATSFREVPAKLLEVNRKVINGYLGRTRGGKVSFTHLIGYAVVRAIADAVPVMNASYVEGDDGKPGVVRHDARRPRPRRRRREGRRQPHPARARASGTPTPSTSAGFWARLRGPHPQGPHQQARRPTTSPAPPSPSPTPARIGTVAVGAPPHARPGRDRRRRRASTTRPSTRAPTPQALADLGVSKVITLTSTYDHRIIQGAESGLFLKRVHELLLGEDDFYDDVFRVARRALRGRCGGGRDVNPVDRDAGDAREADARPDRSSTCTGCGATSSPTSTRWRAKEPHMHPELDPATYGLTIWDLDREFLTDGARRHATRMPLGDILGVLRDAYCRTHRRRVHAHPGARAEALDPGAGRGRRTPTSAADEQRHILDRLNAAEAFEQFLATKYVGPEALRPRGRRERHPAPRRGPRARPPTPASTSAVLGMAHRGRLNVLANIVGKSLRPDLPGVRGRRRPRDDPGLGRREVPPRASRASSSAAPATSMPVELAANPSHLEAVDPVVEGMVRAKQDLIDDPEAFSRAAGRCIHGDAAFAGQGVVAETLNLSTHQGLPGRRHDPPGHQQPARLHHRRRTSARSSEYATDVAKMVQAPIFHVNGDDPEACVRVARLAFAYRQRFHKDVVIDMVCYRRHGHNEGDDPSYTQPLMYKRIEARRSVRKLYTEALVKRGDITLEEAEQALDDFQRRLQAALEETRQPRRPRPTSRPRRRRRPIGVLPHVETGVDRAMLDRVDDALSTPRPRASPSTRSWPSSSRPATKMFAERRGRLGAGRGARLRLAAARGHRHPPRRARTPAGARSRQRHSRARRLRDRRRVRAAGPPRPRPGASSGSTTRCCRSTPPSASSTATRSSHKDALVAWEAQFGDFVNGAQIIIDQFIAAAEDKWGQTLGPRPAAAPRLRGPGPRALLGPHRAVPHAVRRGQHAGRQRHRPRRSTSTCCAARCAATVRKPLVVFTPKSLLRAKSARSPVDELADGLVPGGARRRRRRPTRRRCSGSCSARARSATTPSPAATSAALPAAVVRVEQLYPWPEDAVRRAARAATRTPTEVVWLQEEPENMGPWTFVSERLWPLVPRGHRLPRGVAGSGPAARPPAATPSTSRSRTTS